MITLTPNIESLVASVDAFHRFNMREIVHWVVTNYRVRDNDPFMIESLPTGSERTHEDLSWVMQHAPNGGMLPVLDDLEGSDDLVLLPSTQAECAATVLLLCQQTTPEPEAVEILKRVQKHQREIDKLEAAVTRDLGAGDDWFARVDVLTDAPPLRTVVARTLAEHSAGLEQAREPLVHLEAAILSRLPSWVAAPTGGRRPANTLLTVVTRMCHVAGFSDDEIVRCFDAHSGDRRHANMLARLGRKADYDRHRLAR